MSLRQMPGAKAEMHPQPRRGGVRGARRSRESDRSVEVRAISAQSRHLEDRMANRIRVGIVGATVTQGGSGWGANAHVPALKALPGYELKAVCTAHEDTAKASASAF